MQFNIYEDFFISALAIIIYGWFFQIKWKYLLLGIPPFIIALSMEILSIPYFSYMIILVLIAPLIEEVSKFVFTYFSKNKDMNVGIAVGLMFALIENALYYNAFGSLFLLVFLLREFTDPILHSTTTSISTFTWKKGIGYVGLPVAIVLHMTWNYYSVIMINYQFMVFLIAFVYFVIMYVLKNKVVKE